MEKKKTPNSGSLGRFLQRLALWRAQGRSSTNTRGDGAPSSPGAPSPFPPSGPLPAPPRPSALPATPTARPAATAASRPTWSPQTCASPSPAAASCRELPPWSPWLPRYLGTHSNQKAWYCGSRPAEGAREPCREVGRGRGEEEKERAGARSFVLERICISLCQVLSNWEHFIFLFGVFKIRWVAKI